MDSNSQWHTNQYHLQRVKQKYNRTRIASNSLGIHSLSKQITEHLRNCNGKSKFQAQLEEYNFKVE